ncbi:MAG: right-handed parallel beta-helix repeat-containing protein [Lachnospiraceae bacterium]|uniref:Right-handed parallel beta-helix repeat-containing protein n=1 Tax=Candidatus Weimeria bifida TaxID=2599074 RepID=A0A6N7IZS7_9FIRM|nr:right-handed parallel beta-helix repeat-containing protein [Candidatus Weimeria bifida]RRF96488.1 MAG: right-handed parallel beta-helix repeat-containing protein [Lachnospiraceae bacterium]
MSGKRRIQKGICVLLATVVIITHFSVSSVRAEENTEPATEDTRVAEIGIPEPVIEETTDQDIGNPEPATKKTKDSENKESVTKKAKIPETEETEVTKKQKTKARMGPVLRKKVLVKNAAKTANDGRFTKTLNFSVPKLSSSGYSDNVSFSVSSWKTTGAGRGDSQNASLSLTQSGRSCSVKLENLLDFETYTVKVKYEQAYSVVNANGTVTAKKKTGSLTKSATTPKDTVIRSSYDLKEKVHKYSSLSIAKNIDCGSLQSDIDGVERKKWLVDGDIKKISINGGGHSVKRTEDGFVFRIYNGAKLTLDNANILAYSGKQVFIRTYGGEYETINPSQNAKGSGIKVGMVSAYDEDKSSSIGQLTLNNSKILAHNCAILLRNGSGTIKNSYLYGMGETNAFTYNDFDDYIGNGIYVQNSGNGKADLTVSGTKLYGRFNGVILQGNVKAGIDNCELRGDCGDAVDFRSSGKLNITNCHLYGVKGIDNFDDATYTAVSKSLKNGRLDRNIFNKTIGKKGTVTVSDTSISVNTGAFAGNAFVNSYAVQNRGKLVIGKGVSIKAVHSKAWSLKQSKDRAEACGIYNCLKLWLPADITISADDRGIVGRRNIDAVRNTEIIKKISSAKADSIERSVITAEDISDLLDYGDNSIMNISGGEIKAGNIAVEVQFGSVYIEPERSVKIYGNACGILTGKNGKDKIFDKSNYDPFCHLEIDGSGTAQIQSSLQGTGISVKQNSTAVLIEKNIRISGERGRCANGIKNEGELYLKNANIQAQKNGIINSATGEAYIGDDLDDSGNRVDIKGSSRGLDNNGKCFYYRDVNITDSSQAAVWQNGIFYMLPGSVVEPKGPANSIYLTSKKKNGKQVKSNVRILYEEQYENKLPSIRASFNLAANDRKPGRIMVKLFTADGQNDISSASYKNMADKEKLRIMRQLTGFSLSFDKVADHKAILRCGIGPYVLDKNMEAALQPEEGEKTNGNTGTIVLSCFLSASYDADFPVKSSHLTVRHPERTSFYWKEPKMFRTAPDSYKSDRCHVFWDNSEVTAGLKQTGYIDKDENGYSNRVYNDRIIGIYETDHIFSAIWDVNITLTFDGNGQTNGARNYSKDYNGQTFIFAGNTGPDERSDEYFKKSVTRNRYAYDLMKDRDYKHGFSFQGWSFYKDSSYMTNEVFCAGDTLRWPGQTAVEVYYKNNYSNVEALKLYFSALEHGKLLTNGQNAELKIYVVWDEYPVITANDVSFYADELSDKNTVIKKLLSKDTVIATDREDGIIDRRYIDLYTDPVRKTFSVEAFKNMGDVGSVVVYYSVADKNVADTNRFKQNRSVTSAKVTVLSDDAEDTSDDIPLSGRRGNAGTSSDSYYSTPIYVRSISESALNTLEAKSVWKEERYKKALSEAVKDDSEGIEKWIFSGDDIRKSKDMLYSGTADVLSWRNTFVTNKVSDIKTAESQKNKPLIVEEGLSSVRLTWDINSETDRVEVTVSNWGESKKKTLRRLSGQKMNSGIVFDDLKPDTTYLAEAVFYYRGNEFMTYKETFNTKKLRKPTLSIYKPGSGIRDIRLLFENDHLTESYTIERRCIKGNGVKHWEAIKKIDEFTVNGSGENYLGSDVVMLDTRIPDQGVYRYRVRAFGSRIGHDNQSERSEYSNEVEAATNVI